MSKDKHIFTRGYKECRERLKGNPKYLMSCFNCFYYYLGVGDKEEQCQNDSVLNYDLVMEANNICCLRWKPCHQSTTKQQELFKRKGRGVLD